MHVAARSSKFSTCSETVAAFEEVEQSDPDRYWQIAQGLLLAFKRASEKAGVNQDKATN